MIVENSKLSGIFQIDTKYTFMKFSPKFKLQKYISMRFGVIYNAYFVK